MTMLTSARSEAKEFYVYGTGGIGIVLAEVMFSMGYRLNGAFDDKEGKEAFYGVEVNPGLESAAAGFPVLDQPLFVCLGNNRLRKTTVSRVQAPFMVAVHPRAHISGTARLGEGTMVFHGSYVQAEARLGRHVIVNTAASIDHHCKIADFVHIAPQVALCGLCEVGEGTEIGAGAAVLPSIKIGKWCQVGAGAVVLGDIPDYATAVGNPAKVIKIKGERV
jgi:sugar O-acyltransferase (sialic acid O-acetyltransferase NeuD family)